MGISSANANARDGTPVNTKTMLVMTVVLGSRMADADGGTIQLREASGPIIVTVLTAPEVVRVGPMDTSVLVQNRETGAVILDATVNLASNPAAEVSRRVLSRAAHSQATNKLLQAATINVSTPGWWDLEVTVRSGGEEKVFATKVLVAPSAPRWRAIWPFLIVPPLGIGLFVLHETLRRT
jgi:hypothetical protein